MNLVWSASALAAERIATEIDGAATSLLDFPEMGAPGPLPGTRKRVVTGTRYLLTYAVRDDNLVILNVWHGRQNWKR